jgi:cysteine dioxygenase
MRVIDTTTAYTTEPAPFTNEMTLDELAAYINNLTAIPTVAQIKEKFASLLLRQRDYDAYRLFTAKKYARNLIARSEFAELLMLCWHSGQRTPIHDHGGSIGVVLVCEGSMTETMYEVVPEGHVRPYNTFRWSPGGITGAEVPDIHQLLNLQPEPATGNPRYGDLALLCAATDRSEYLQPGQQSPPEMARRFFHRGGRDLIA